MINIPGMQDDFFPANIYAEIRDRVLAAPLKYGSKSNKLTDPHGHLKWAPIHDKTENLADLTQFMRLTRQPFDAAWDHIKGHLGHHKLLRFYANSYSYGMDGYFHTDSSRQDEITCIIFICNEWDPDWAGELVAKDDKRYMAALPKPNRVLFIPSTMQHAARAVSRKCYGMRTTLMYKMRKPRSASFEQLSEFLVGKGALALPHMSGSLHDHLVRVYSLLEGRGCNTDTCLGGGLHSVYGTNAYVQQLLEPNASTRAMIAGEFGRQAEELAYLFSVIDRPKTLEGYARCPFNDNTEVLLSLRHAATVTVNGKTFRDLCMIEAANLLDQGSLDKWPILKKLWESAK